MRLALDAMGGDHAPGEIVRGAVAARDAMPEEEILLVGDETAIRRELDAAGASRERLQIVHASQVVGMAESPVEAVRRKADSSMRRAVELMAHREADAVVSAGNTGAFVAAAHMIAKRLPGIRRPGISVVFPTFHGPVVVIDVGANVDSRPLHLFQYGVMASVYAREVFAIAEPRVGILSIGEESEKGNELAREARELMTGSSLRFCGNAEGRDIFNGRFDVVVCDGFVGNIVLKCVEALAGSVFQTIMQEVAAMGADAQADLLPVMTQLQRRHDAEEYGGAPLLGVDGVVIISHGNAKARGIANALRVGDTYARQEVNRTIVDEVAKAGGGHA
ncbi:MAG TPA: phosphate acyltransferase PlsX [Phycisphaerae bacterium]|nr:phosphate acyltransferase PlsX [Phycisphaerae bacterium]